MSGFLLERVLAIASDCGARVDEIEVPVALIRFTGSINGGALLFQVINQSLNSASECGWFRKTYLDWRGELLLSEVRVKAFTKEWTERGWLETKVMKVNGVPNLHYRVKPEELQEDLLAFQSTPVKPKYRRPAIPEWAAIRRSVFIRDTYVCQYCGANDQELHCDHILPISRGGTNELGNLATACKTCNLSKGGRTVEEWKGGAS